MILLDFFADAAALGGALIVGLYLGHRIAPRTGPHNRERP